MHETPSCVVRPLSEVDLEMVLAWRNRAEVREAMLTQHEIQPDEHRRWFDMARNDSTRCMLLVEHDERPTGFVHFSGIMHGGVADWGFYTAPAMPPGSGSCICHAALDYVFGTFELHKVCGQVLAHNAASLHLHRKLGFVEEGVLREHQRIGETYSDLVCFGLLRREWHGTAG